jgi:triacylglycerol lipase
MFRLNSLDRRASKDLNFTGFEANLESPSLPQSSGEGIEREWRPCAQVASCLFCILFALVATDRLDAEQLVIEPTTELRIERDVVFREIEGTQLTADFFRPDNQKILPGILMIHGGAWIAGDKWNMVGHAIEMAEAGFVVMAINYRLSPGVKWPSHLEDCREALRWLSEREGQWNVDTRRLAAWGYSAGAQLALLLALHPEADQPLIRACVAGGTPWDLTIIPDKSSMLASVFGGPRKKFPEVYRAASPISYLDRSSPPIFLFHGSKDLLVPFEQSKQAFEKAGEIKLDVELVEVSDLGHITAFFNKAARRRAIEFLIRRLEQ